jgi:uncharacterized protein YdhG (YjbR/CyaY superfamily)
MTVVDTYLKKVSVPQRTELERIRKIIKKAVPDAEECISYGMPAFKYKKKYLIGYAAFAHHMSVFPASNPIEVMADKLKDFKLSKGTVQFTLEYPIPASIIQELVAIRIRDIEDPS